MHHRRCVDIVHGECEPLVSHAFEAAGLRRPFSHHLVTARVYYVRSHTGMGWNATRKAPILHSFHCSLGLQRSSHSIDIGIRRHQQQCPCLVLPWLRGSGCTCLWTTLTSPANQLHTHIGIFIPVWMRHVEVFVFISERECMRRAAK